MTSDRLITLAIHTYDRAIALRQTLEAEGIEATLQNVCLDSPKISSGVRVRIHESDLPMALRIVENPQIFEHGQASDSDNAHRILVPMDFSPHAINAAEFANSLAAVRKAEIVFLHSYIDPSLAGHVSLSDKLTFDSPANDESERIAAMASSRMRDFANTMREKMRSGALSATPFSTRVCEGVPEDVINDFANRHSPFLVVMGTREAAQKENDLIGSVTASVLDSCRYPVISIPANCDIQKCINPRNILFFSNIDQEDIIAMDALARLFPDAEMDVTIVNVPQRNLLADLLVNRSAMALTEYCTKNFRHFTFRTVPLSSKTAAEQLRKEQIEKKFDLLVVPNRHKSAFMRLFNPGLTYKILFQADIPMLVIPV